MARKAVGAAPSGTTDIVTKGYVDTALSSITSGPLNNNSASGTAHSLSTTSALIGSVTLTVANSSSEVLVLGYVSLTKDTGTTARTATLKMVRGTTTGSTQVGQTATAVSPATASAAYYAQDSLGGTDSPGASGSITYSLFGNVGAGASTCAWTIIAIELTGAVGPEGPAGDTLSVSNAQTGDYTLILTDVSKSIDVTSSSAHTVTVPTNASVAFAIGTIVEVSQLGTGQVTIAGASGVTINSADSLTKTRVQFSAVSLRKTATNTWLLAGDLA